MALDSKQRFSNRASDYLRYRPGYPSAVLDVLRAECGLTAQSIVADVGSGTGILTKLFLENGNVAYGIEPNAAMREAGEEFLRPYRRFRSISASAEATTLPASSVDFVTVGQAFHWFDPTATRAEFRRILKPSGWVAIVSNERLRDSSPFQKGYEALLEKYGTDYKQVSETYVTYDKLKEFFGEMAHWERSFANEQIFDFDGLRGRLLSSSYSPTAGDPNFEPMLDALRALFDLHQAHGRVRFDYATRLHCGRL